MVSIRDKFLSAHRSQIKSALWGKLNVFNSLLFFSLVDWFFLSFFWVLHFMAVHNFECSAFRNELIVNTVLTVSTLISLFPKPFLFYTAFGLYIVRFWHVCHIAGKVAGLMVFHVTRLSFTSQKKLYEYYLSRIQILPSGVGVALIRLLMIILSVWYALVLQRIRVAGGTGREKKSAEDFESEILERLLSHGNV